MRARPNGDPKSGTVELGIRPQHIRFIAVDDLTPISAATCSSSNAGNLTIVCVDTRCRPDAVEW